MKPVHLIAEVTVDSPPLSLNQRRILHDLFQQDPDLESRSKHHAAVGKVVDLQRRD